MLNLADDTLNRRDAPERGENSNDEYARLSRALLYMSKTMAEVTPDPSRAFTWNVQVSSAPGVIWSLNDETVILMPFSDDLRCILISLVEDLKLFVHKRVRLASSTPSGRDAFNVCMPGELTIQRCSHILSAVHKVYNMCASSADVP